MGERTGVRTPLNGTKTHPLSAHALDVLRSIWRSPVPCQAINAGVVNRLMREDLAVIVPHPSPYVTHKGRMIDHLAITEAGQAVLAKASE